MNFSSIEYILHEEQLPGTFSKDKTFSVPVNPRLIWHRSSRLQWHWRLGSGVIGTFENYELYVVFNNRMVFGNVVLCVYWLGYVIILLVAFCHNLYNIEDTSEFLGNAFSMLVTVLVTFCLSLYTLNIIKKFPTICPGSGTVRFQNLWHYI